MLLIEYSIQKKKKTTTYRLAARFEALISNALLVIQTIIMQAITPPPTTTNNNTSKMRLSTSNDTTKPDNFQINAKICRLVEHYPCMYDRSHPHYLKKDVVDKAWVKISEEMDDSIPSCKERWRNIRTSFARSININKVPSSANRTKPYYLHEELKFLARHITPGIPVSRRPNFYTSADMKSEMIEVPIGEESFDGFVAMAAQNEEEEEEEKRQRQQLQQMSQQQNTTNNEDETQTQPEERGSSRCSVNEGTVSVGGGEQVRPLSRSVEEMQTDAMEEKLAEQSSPLPLVQHTQQQQQQQQHELESLQQQYVPQFVPQQQQVALPPPQQQQLQPNIQQQQQLPPPPPPPSIEPIVPERIVTDVPTLPLYPFKKRLRPAEPIICAEVEQERDVKPQPSELSTPDPDFDAAFLQGLLPEMKAMDFRQKILFKKRIYEVIGEIFENTTTNACTSRRTSQHSLNFNANTACATPPINGYTSNSYANGYPASNKSRGPTPTPTPTPASSPNPSGYASPLNVFNTSATPNHIATATTTTTTAMGTVNAADLALIRRLSTLLQSPAVVSSTSAGMSALPKNVASISSTVRTHTSSAPTTATSSPASTVSVHHRGAITRSSANLLRNTMANGSMPTSSTTYGSSSSSSSSTSNNGGGVSYAVKQELLDE